MYLIGDSHAANIYSAWGGDFKNLHFRSLLGYGLQSLVNRSTNRKHVNLEYVYKVLDEIKKNCVIIMSYTDADSRIGFSENEKYKNVLDSYTEAVDLLFDKTSARKIIFLDWYGILNKKCEEQIFPPDRRVMYRSFQVEALTDISKRYPIVLDTTFRLSAVEPNGFCLPSFMKENDGVHYDLNNATIKETLHKRFVNYVKSRRQ